MQGITSDRAIALTSLMSKWFAASTVPRQREREPVGWKHLHLGEVHGIVCQHLQEKVTQLLQKHWEVGAGQKELHLARQ